ncbi:MAG: NAD(P)/FAD-dependent oxidoreductase [Alphaproteobacteria bacterium]
MTPNNKKIAIVGAGISGLTLAHKLKNFHQVDIFEKSRGVSGRLASRTRDEFTFDFGSQFFIAKNPDFKIFLEPFINKKILQPWCGNFVEIDNYKITYQRSWDVSHNHLVSAPKMTEFCKELAVGLNIKFQTKIIKIEKKLPNKKWELSDENGVLGDYDWVLLSIPPEQLCDLISPTICFYSQAKKVKMQSCFALMLGLEDFVKIPYDMALIKNSIISWLSAEASKPDRKKIPAYTILARNNWADSHIDDDIENIKHQMIEEFKKITGANDIVIKHSDIHRWRYANLGKQNHPNKFLLDYENQIASCGDWNIQGRVEAGFISASELAKEICFKI